MSIKKLFKRDVTPLAPAIVEAVIGRDHLDHKLRCEGYEVALTDLMQGLRGCNSFALVSIEPAIRQMQGKLRKMKQEN